MNREQMLAPFADEEIRQFQGRGNKTMTYIEDETVMDRLDVGYGPGNWSLLVEPVNDQVVKVRLGVREETDWTWYEDFGYPNGTDGEALKEAVSDGIRRCGRYVGIGRDLYRKRTYETGGVQTARQPRQNAPQRPPAPVATRAAAELLEVRPHLVDTDLLDPGEEAIDALHSEPTARADYVRCPIHDVPWTGSVGDLYHRKGEGGFCRHPENVRKAAR